MAGITEKTLNAIEIARTKSERARHTIALIIAGSFTFILFLIWAFVLLPFKLDNVTQNSDTKSNSPFSSLKAQVGSAYDDFMNNIHGQAQKTGNTDSSSLQDSYNRIKSSAQDNTQN